MALFSLPALPGVISSPWWLTLVVNLLGLECTLHDRVPVKACPQTMGVSSSTSHRRGGGFETQLREREKVREPET